MKYVSIFALIVGFGLVGAGGCFVDTASDCLDNETCAEPGDTTSGSSSTTSSGTAGGTPAGCVPADEAAPVEDKCGVFVSSSLGDDATADGSKAKPYATITAALSAGSRLYLCAEEFEEQVVLPAGSTLYGALDCTSDWSYSDQTKSQLTAAADTIPLKLSSGSGTTEAYDLKVTAKDATSPGSSSIAVLVEGATANFERCELMAGKGGDGADGMKPDGTGMVGTVGEPGKIGCTSSSLVEGGVGMLVTCGDGSTSTGGAGGDSKTNQNGGSGNEGISSPPVSMPAGAGGLGQKGTKQSPVVCETGKPGGAGDPGAPGAGGTGLGTLSSSGYSGSNGEAGQSTGTPGQGGGGGGASKGQIACSTPSHAGHSGGSGGTGGCGGSAGPGGTAAGSSIALASVSATVTVANSTLSASDGASGGKGASGQDGGAGKAGGIALDGNACAGGLGGTGGPGGPGGGGLGGHSLGIAYTGTAPTEDAVTITFAAAGAGGIGGTSGSVEGGKGDDGKASERLSFDE